MRGEHGETGRTAPSPRPLDAQHRRMLLEDSGIASDVVQARGYRSVHRKIALTEKGFSRNHQNVPGLLIPIYGTTGEISLYQYRPDEPRIGKDGKVVKYVTPAESKMVVDVHPSVRDQLDDPSVRLFLTEGVKKGDALVSRGQCAIALLGVWNWRGTNEHGGKTALPDWEDVALNGREIYVVFDSDVMLKPEVHKALERFKAFLEGRSAHVRLIYLPTGEGRKKQGVDDYLAAGRTVDDLLALATTELRRPPSGEFKPNVPYRATPHGLLWAKPTKEGPVLVPLTNFTARIIADVAKDDSVEVFRELEVEGKRGETTEVFTIPAARLGTMDWVVEHLGAGAVVYAGFGTKDHARAAVQLLSGDVPRRYEYAHLGWREIDGSWFYLHSGGAVGAGHAPAVTTEEAPRDPSVTAPEAEGSRRDGREDAGSGASVTPVTPSEIYTQPPSALAGYTLPEPPAGDEIKEAVQASIRASEVANPSVTAPGFAAVWRAPLGPTDFGLHYHGRTGLGKSELAALFQQHYGPEMNARNLPASWSSTANANEGLAFAAKDAVMVVDDFAPTGSTTDQARLHRDADRLFRGKGNALGRQRMRPDGSLRPQKPPRALIVSTGEDVPRGHSLRSRVLVVNVDSGDLDWQRLTESQRDGAAGRYARAMAAYLGWLAARYGEVQASLRREIEEEREGLRREGQHPRTPEIVANLRVGLRYFLRFAVEVGAITETQADGFRKRWHAALAEVDLDQSRYHASEDPVEQFLDLVRASIQGGSAHLADQKSGREPESKPGQWGWQLRFELEEWVPRGTKIGWISADNNDVFLSADNAYAAAQELARKQNANIPVSKETLIKYLKERHLLASIEKETGRATPRRRMAGKVTRVLHLSAHTLFPEPPEDDGPDDEPSGGETPPGEDRQDTSDDPSTNGGQGLRVPASQLATPHTPVQGSQGSRQAEEARHDRLCAVTPVPAERSPGGHGAALLRSRAELVAPADVPALLEEIQSARVVGLDLETTGLNPRRHRIRLLSLATERGVWVLDLYALYAADPTPVLTALKPKTLVIHNAAFDLGFLHEFGYEHGGEVIDTLLLSQLLHAGAVVPPLNNGQTSHALDAVCQRELGIELDKTQQTADWGDGLTPEMVEYAARDAEVLILLYRKLMEQVEEAGLERTTEIERRALPAILWMARVGAPFDEARWLELAEVARKEADRINARLRDTAPPRSSAKEWNWNSASQIKAALAALGIHTPNTREETLAQYDQGFVRLLREYKKKSKLASSYGEKWLHHKDGTKRVTDGRIYPHWKQIGAATGRMACSDPNLQAIPHGSGHHSCVRAPEGRALIRADFSQLELRLAAKMWSETVMLKTFREGGDIHLTTARSITSNEQITKEDRKRAKAVNFGLIFGQRAKGLRQYARNKYGVDMNFEEAVAYRRRFFETYPAIRRWHTADRARSRRGEFGTRTLTGRRRQNVRFFTERLNAPVQGTAADGMKMALALLWERRDECPGAVPVLAVHDEIVIECGAEQAQEAKDWLVRAMKDGMDTVVNKEEPRVPIEVEASISEAWGD